jgi:hypothetical protein
MSQDAPSNASELVGECDSENVVMQPLLGRFEPRLEPVSIPALRLDQYNPCGLNEQNPQVATAALRYLAEEMVRSPVEICLGTRPSQAAKSRPFENPSPAPIAATNRAGDDWPDPRHAHQALTAGIMARKNLDLIR